MFPVVLVGLLEYVSNSSHAVSKVKRTHEGVAAVAADGNLRLVGVDEDLGVSCWATTALANNIFAVCPFNGNLVNKHHRGIGLWLQPLVSPSVYTGVDTLMPAHT